MSLDPDERRRVEIQLSNTEIWVLNRFEATRLIRKIEDAIEKAYPPPSPPEAECLCSLMRKATWNHPGPSYCPKHQP